MFAAAYGSGSERSEEEKNDFWDEQSEYSNDFRADEIVAVLGDLNAMVGEFEIEGVTGMYRVLGVSESGQRLIEMCSVLRLLIGNTFFKKQMIHKYTRERVTHCMVVDRTVMYYVIMPRHMRGRLFNSNFLRGIAGEMSDDYLVEKVMRVKC